MILGRSDLEGFNAMGCKCAMLLQSFVCEDLGDGDYKGRVVEVEISE